MIVMMVTRLAMIVVRISQISLWGSEAQENLQWIYNFRVSWNCIIEINISHWSRFYNFTLSHQSHSASAYPRSLPVHFASTAASTRSHPICRWAVESDVISHPCSSRLSKSHSQSSLSFSSELQYLKLYAYGRRICHRSLRKTRKLCELTFHQILIVLLELCRLVRHPVQTSCVSAEAMKLKNDFFQQTTLIRCCDREHKKIENKQHKKRFFQRSRGWRQCEHQKNSHSWWAMSNTSKNRKGTFLDSSNFLLILSENIHGLFLLKRL